MKRSTDHILTTHTGSLPRPLDLVDMVLRKEAKRPVDEDDLAMRVRSAVAELCNVDRPLAIGFRTGRLSFTANGAVRMV